MSDTTEIATIEVMEPGALEAQERATVDMQISTAKRYPRVLAKVKQEMETMALLDKETAESCSYSLKRGNKNIIGPSVRLAEIAMCCFGNIRAASRVIGNDGRFITAQGVAIDLEKNVSLAAEVKVRITNKEGKVYNEDMQGIAANAACAKAFRNAVFKVVPLAVVKPIMAKALKHAAGKEKSLPDRRNEAIASFKSEYGIKVDELLQYLGRKKLTEVDISDIGTLLGLFTSLKDSELTVEGFRDDMKGDTGEGKKPETETTEPNEGSTEPEKGEEGSSQGEEGQEPEKGPEPDDKKPKGGLTTLNRRRRAPAATE